LKVAWVRGSKHIGFNKPSTFFTLGVRGSGKSSFIEHVGELYHAEGHTILDLFGSRDGEGLAWLRHPLIDPNTVLLVHGDNVDVSAPADTRPVSRLTLEDFEKYDVVISSSPLYSSPDDEFRQVNRITSLLYRRQHWSHLVYMIVREAANLYYSRIKITQNQTQAKADMTYLIREARHMGVALGLDTLKFTSIDSDIRAVTDFMIFKAQGVAGLPRDLYWVYRYFDPQVMQRLKPHEFIIMHRGGALGLGVFEELPWHKREREHILTELGIVCEYGEEIDYGRDLGKFKQLGDPDHAAVIAEYMEGEGGMAAVAERLGISSGTVHRHIKIHNKAVRRFGVCEKCGRVAGPYMNTLAEKTWVD